jgi:hypothetical protein
VKSGRVELVPLDAAITSANYATVPEDDCFPANRVDPDADCERQAWRMSTSSRRQG